MTRRLGRLAFVGTLGLLLLVVTAAPASAHAVLESTSPADGTAYGTATAPRAVSMHFGEDVGVKLGGVRVYDDRGKLVDTGEPEHPGGDGSTVAARLPKLGVGTYVVTWRVISADTHPVGGAFTFTVGAATHDVRALTTRLLSSASGSRTVGVLYGAVRVLELAALLVLIGAAAFAALVWPGARRSGRTRKVLWGAWWTLLAVTALGFVVEGIYAAAFPLRDLLQPDVLRDTWHSRYGEMAVLRAALLAAAIPVLLRLHRSAPPPEPAGGSATEYDDAPLPAWWAAVAIALAVGLCLTVTLAGHAVTGRWQVLALPADLLHLLGASLWLGGLVMLVVVALPAAAPTELDHLVPRYSLIAAGSVIALVVSGAFQALRQVGTLHALTSTSYGQILLVKLGVFVVLVVVAALSRDVVRLWYRAPAARRDEVTAALTGGRDPDETVAPSDGGGAVGVLEREDGPDVAAQWARGRLLRTAGLEVVLLVVVLVVTALLVDARPAYEATTGPAELTMKTSSMWFDVIIEPATVGPNQVHLTAVDPTGGIADPAEMTMELTNPSHSVGPLQVPLIRAGPGHELTQGFQIPFAGDWQVTVKALVSDVDEVTATQTITVR